MKNHLNLEERVFSPARAAERRSLSFTLKDYRAPENRASTRLSRVDLSLALRMTVHKKKRPGHPQECYKIFTLLLGSGSARERKPVRLRREGGELHRSAFVEETSCTVKGTQPRSQMQKRHICADLVSQSTSEGYKSRRCLGRLAHPTVF